MIELKRPRFGFYAARDTLRGRADGNRRRFILIDVPSFLRGYNLFVPLMRADLTDATMPFEIRWRRQY